MDPNGREIKNKDTKNIIETILKLSGNNKLSDYIKSIIGENLVQGQPNKFIKDYIYIADNKEIVEKSASQILFYSESPDFLVTTKQWTDLDNGIRTDVTEYWIYVHNSPDESNDWLFQIYIDVMNDGYIDYVMWKDFSEEN